MVDPKNFIALGLDPRNIPTQTLTIPGGHWDYQSDSQQRLTRAQRTIQQPRQPGEIRPQPPEQQPAEDYYYDRAGNRLFAGQRLHSEQDIWQEIVRQNQHRPDFNPLQQRAPSESVGLKNFHWPSNQVLDNGHYTYKHDDFGNVTERWTQPNDEGETEHHYLKYNPQQQLVRHEVQYKQSKSVNFNGYDKGRVTTYQYDPTGRRILKETQTYENGQPSNELQATFYGWDGNQLVLTEQGDRHIHTIYEPNSFVPMIRIEGKKAPPMVSLARKIKEHYQVNIDRDSMAVIEQIERELRTGKLTRQHEQDLIRAGLQPEELEKLLDPEPTMEGKTIHHFINDHLGTPQFLINQDLQIDWYREQSPWGKTITEFNLKNLHQPIRMQGQHYDEESGLHYNLHRYYDPAIGRHLTLDPIGLKGGLNPYAYANNNPMLYVDPDGLLFMSTLGGLQRETTLNEAATYGAPGNAALATGLTGAATGGVIIAGARLVVPAAAVAGREIWKRVDIDGPNKAFLKYGNGTICQLRFNRKPVIRLDYHPYRGTHNESRLHINIGPEKGGPHISLDPRSFRD